MITLDESLLRELGLSELPVADKQLMLTHIYETLELRVGTTLTSRLDADQIDEFEALIDADDDAGSLAFLQRVVPDYRDIVTATFKALCEEIQANADQILAASQ